MAARYRKRPVEVEAMRYDGSEASSSAIRLWVDATDPGRVEGFFDGEYVLVVHTLEGEMRAAPGWWIIRGVAGEFYPCKPGLFEESYEEVQDEAG
jgi:hypothetical protein